MRRRQVRAVISKPKVRPPSPFHHIHLWVGSHLSTHRPLPRLVFRQMRSIPLTLSSKSSQATAALAWLNLGIGYSTMKLMPGFQLSASKETNCSMEPGDTTPAGATASLRTSRPDSRYPHRAL